MFNNNPSNTFNSQFSKSSKSSMHHKLLFQDHQSPIHQKDLIHHPELPQFPQMSHNQLSADQLNQFPKNRLHHRADSRLHQNKPPKDLMTRAF